MFLQFYFFTILLALWMGVGTGFGKNRKISLQLILYETVKFYNAIIQT
jgi:hypothetical protein